MSASGVVVADTGAAVRTFETSHPPSWYIPTDAIAPGLLGPSQRQSFCEWEGGARYWHLDVRGQMLSDIACYPEPTPGFAILLDCAAFCAGPLDLCALDGERARPQPGGFHGGWITAELAGPFKAAPGSNGW